MDLLKEIVALVGGTAGLLAAVAWLFQALINARVKRDLEEFKSDLRTREIAEKDRLASKRDERERTAAAASARNERIRLEVHRWANPILGAVEDLRRRLENIVSNEGFMALDLAYKPTPPQVWSIPYEYFLPSTLYLFAQYFYVVLRLQQTLSFELFETQKDKDDFLAELHKVSQALGDWPLKPPLPGADSPVFRLEQRGIGEALASPDERERCLGFHEFMEIWDGPPLSDRLQSLRMLLDGLAPTHICRWTRLKAVLSAVQSLEGHCKAILQVPNPNAPKPASTMAPPAVAA